MLRSLVVFSIVVMCGAALDAFSIQSQPNRLSGANAQVSVKRNPADRRWQEVTHQDRKRVEVPMNECVDKLVGQLNDRITYTDFHVEPPNFEEQDVIIKFKNGVAKAPLSYANADQDAHYELDETDCRTYLYFSLLPYNMHVGGSIYANSTIAAADLDFSLDLFSIDQTIAIEPDLSMDWDSLGLTHWYWTVELSGLALNNSTMDELASHHLESQGLISSLFHWQELTLLHTLVYPIIREELAANPDGVCSALVPAGPACQR